MTKLRILIPDAYTSDLSSERAILADAEFVVHQAHHADEIPLDDWQTADVVLLWHRIRVTPELVARMDRCRHIVRVGVGFDNVDLEACSRRGIAVSNVPNYGTTEIADHALALLLSLVRGLSSYDQRLRHDMAGRYFAEDVPVVRRLRGATFGAVGLGRVGTAISRRAQAFDTSILFYDPFLPEGHELGTGYRRTHSLSELLQCADIVSIHTPLNSETRGMVDRAWLAKMKADAILINVARGQLMDLDAVEEALRSGHLAAAGLDVLPDEPPDPQHPLLKAWRDREEWLAGRLVLTPHAAFFSADAYRDMKTFAVEIVRDFLATGVPRNNLNPDWLKFAAHARVRSA
jgi:D-3-phosphoglycerate dehydrogenase